MRSATKATSRHRITALSAVCLAAVLSIPVSGCSTFGDIGGSINGALGGSQVELLDTQKSIVVNYLDQANPQAALREIRRMVAEHPNNPDVLNLAGLTHLALKNTKVAARFFEKSYKQKGETSTALNLSSAYIELGDYDRAGKILRKLVIDGDAREYRYRERIFHNLGLVAQQTGKSKLAEKYYDRAIEENPVFYKTHIQMARVHMQAGRTKDALESAQKAQQSCPRCIDALDELVTTALAAKAADKAIAAVNEFLKGEDLVPVEKLRAEGFRQKLRSALVTQPETSDSPR